MKKHLKEIVKELIENLDKRGFVYQGYDNSNYCELFIKKLDYIDGIVRVSLMPDIISFEAVRYDIDKLRGTPFVCDLKLDELGYFKELLDILTETRESFPKELAKNQKNLDNFFKFETGQ